MLISFDSINRQADAATAADMSDPAEGKGGHSGDGEDLAYM